MLRTATILVTLLWGLHVSAEEPHPGANDFVEKVVAEYGLDPDDVREILAEARYKQSIIDAITRPAEGRPWHEYHPIFLNDARIDGGVEFWRANRELLEEVSGEFGVPVEIIVAIVGVETNFGFNTGGFRVIDALVTLGFYFPRRSGFFSSELAHFLHLTEEESLPATEVEGSYAGAMGLGQFIPSSYRAYAVDFDGDGRRNLWRSLPDALASVANYLAEHGWETGSRAFLEVTSVPDDAEPETSRELDTTLGELAGQGYEFEAPELDPDTPAMLVQLETENGHETRIGLKNFYVITRYNRSPLYAMAVIELAEAIRERRS